MTFMRCFKPEDLMTHVTIIVLLSRKLCTKYIIWLTDPMVKTVEAHDVISEHLHQSVGDVIILLSYPRSNYTWQHSIHLYNMTRPELTAPDNGNLHIHTRTSQAIVIEKKVLLFSLFTYKPSCAFWKE